MKYIINIKNKEIIKKIDYEYVEFIYVMQHLLKKRFNIGLTYVMNNNNIIASGKPFDLGISLNPYGKYVWSYSHYNRLEEIIDIMGTTAEQAGYNTLVFTIEMTFEEEIEFSLFIIDMLKIIEK